MKKRDPERDPRVTFFLLFFRSLRLCSAQRILKSDWVNLTFAALRLTFIRGHWRFLKVSCRSRDYRATLRSRSTFQNLESTTWLAKRGKGMSLISHLPRECNNGKGIVSSVEQAFVGREEIRAPLKTPAWEASKWRIAIQFHLRLCNRGNLKEKCCFNVKLGLVRFILFSTLMPNSIAWIFGNKMKFWISDKIETKTFNNCMMR